MYLNQDRSPDSKYIVTGDAATNVKVWEFDGTNIGSTPEGTATTPTGVVRSVKWSPDGKYILSADGGNYVRVFDAMGAPQNCFVDSCKVCDTTVTAISSTGLGIAGGGRNYFTDNICCNNEANFTYGISNVFFGDYNTMRPFDNLSMPQAW